ncbi:MAG: hypothetical protein DI603_20545 [Roseateles depolymerans]|uniref:Uncharacterized protein n=1 Tax=Roseateles depolymerans TaxID=76731 RepID=A0A2W5DB85_9BURK|nr:MAG: hypothetical protein DI603_20545 [Roseateles depolymerans]
MNMIWLLLILAVALIVYSALRFDVLIARWRELTRPGGDARDGPPATATPPATGMRPHEAPPGHKPDYHRSGRRH